MEHCQIGKKKFEINCLFPLELIRKPAFDLIHSKHKDLDNTGFICGADACFYHLHLKNQSNTIKKPLQDSPSCMNSEPSFPSNFTEDYDEKLTIGEQLADRMAEFGGSWKFILSFTFFISLWILLNSCTFFFKPLDPYPYILLNLILSCLAAIQAPIIMMSQNRQEKKDRIHAIMDYRVNLKSEYEIRRLNDKIDTYFHLQKHQIEELSNKYKNLSAEEDLYNSKL